VEHRVAKAALTDVNVILNENKIRLHTLLFVFPQFLFTETLHVSAVVSHHQA
jgi:hypothetical protein